MLVSFDTKKEVIIEAIVSYALMGIFDTRVGSSPKFVHIFKGKFKTWRLNTFIKVKNLNIKLNKKIDFSFSFEEIVSKRVDLNLSEKIDFQRIGPDFYSAVDLSSL